MEKAEVERAENSDSSEHEQKLDTSRLEDGGFVDDKKRAARLRRKIDLRIFEVSVRSRPSDSLVDSPYTA